MDVKTAWISEPDRAEASFENDDSAYAHYWLKALPPTQRRAGRSGKRSSVVDVTTRLEAATEDLIERAFDG